MRELTLIENGYLAGLLLLSLVLPLMLSARYPGDARHRRTCLRTVWIGQILLATAGLSVMLSTALAGYATVFGAATLICCVLALRRQLLASPPFA